MKPKVKQSQQVGSGFYQLKHDLLENHKGLTTTYTSVLLPNAVTVLAQTKEGLWVLNREYRHPAGQTLLGLPGGRLEEGEDPLFGGQRELFEETGYWSDELECVGGCYSFPSLCNQQIFYIWAKNAYKKSEQSLEPFEFIEVELKSDQELRHEIRSGRPVDGNLCAALWYKDHFC